MRYGFGAHERIGATRTFLALQHGCITVQHGMRIDKSRFRAWHTGATINTHFDAARTDPRRIATRMGDPSFNDITFERRAP